MQKKMYKKYQAMIRSSILIVYCLFCCSSIQAMSVDSLWNQANQKYTDGQFAEASALYEQILATGQESADLYFNLGNAYYRQKLVGLSRINFERALRIEPENADIIHNLEFAKALQLDKIDERQEMFLTTWFNSIMNVLSAKAWAVLFIVLFAVLMGLALIYLFTSSYRWRQTTFLTGLIITVLMLLSFSFGSAQRSKQIDNSHAIIFTPVVTVKGSPDASGADLFIVHEGLKVKVIDKQGSWRRIVLSDGKSQGWISQNDMEII